MNRKNRNTNQTLRRFLQHAESFNRCMFPKSSSNSFNKSNDDDLILCEKAMEDLNLSSIHSKSIREKTSADEILLADVVSNEYQYDASSIQFNLIQQCCIVSITSPYVFSIQLTQDFVNCDHFFKEMNDFYNSINDLHIPVEYLRSNLLCVTWDEQASVWNRSQILEYDLSMDTVNVFFVDLNSWEENVNRSRIRFILTKYSSRPVHLLTCRLASILPTNGKEQWDDIALKTFQNVIQNRKSDVNILYQGQNSTFYVNLYVSHEEAYVFVNEFLVHCRMAELMKDNNLEQNIEQQFNQLKTFSNPIMKQYWDEESKIVEQHETTIPKFNKNFHEHVIKRSDRSTQLRRVRQCQIDKDKQIVFVRFESYTRIPDFILLSLLHQYNEVTLEKQAKSFGFKPIKIDPLSHPSIWSELIRYCSSSSILTQIKLYSIDCVRKILNHYSYNVSTVYDLLDEARFSEASQNLNFWRNQQIILSKRTIEK